MLKSYKDMEHHILKEFIESTPVLAIRKSMIIDGTFDIFWGVKEAEWLQRNRLTIIAQKYRYEWDNAPMPLARLKFEKTPKLVDEYKHFEIFWTYYSGKYEGSY